MLLEFFFTVVLKICVVFFHVFPCPSGKKQDAEKSSGVNSMKVGHTISEAEVSLVAVMSFFKEGPYLPDTS